MSYKWFKTIKSILKKEPEVWLSYLQGQTIEEFPYYAFSKPSRSGLIYQFIKFPYRLVRQIDYTHINDFKQSTKCDYYVFFATSNQLNSINSTIKSLKSFKQQVHVTSTASLAKTNSIVDIDSVFSLNYTDVIKSIILMLTRFPKLYIDLKHLHPDAVNNWYADFCSAYFYLVYFERILTKNKAKFVITANDHSVPNRCLIAIAHELGIKTAYLQHASVSNIFPALRLNYAFLDGQRAFDTYKQCETNQPSTDRNVPKPDIFLTGQKKPLANRSRAHSKCTIGIAFNLLDDIDNIIHLSEQLSKFNLNIVLRWHPRQNISEINKLKKHFTDFEKVLLSDPDQETVGQYLSRINWLISGNSSIHLEAALVGVIPIYYESIPAIKPDYYGYVKSGLAKKASNICEIQKIIIENQDANSLDDSAIRYYSSTYKTVWEGKEGELVAECLIALKNKTATPIKSFNINDEL